MRVGGVWSKHLETVLDDHQNEAVFLEVFIKEKNLS